MRDIQMKCKLSSSIALFMLLSGCLSFQSPYTDFVESMGVYVSSNKTISELEKFTHIAWKEYLTNVELLNNGNKKYHYAHDNIWARHCHYYFLVDGKTDKVFNWGFDHEKSDPKQNCGRSG